MFLDGKEKAKIAFFKFLIKSSKSQGFDKIGGNYALHANSIKIH